MSEVKVFKCIGYMEQRSRAGGERWVSVDDFDRVTAERDAALAELSEIKESLAYRGSLLCRIEGQRDALQQRLTAADERADVLEWQLAARESELEEFATEMTLAISDSQIRSAMTVIGRSRFLQLLQAYNARIDAALRATEDSGDECAHSEANKIGCPECGEVFK